MAADQSSDGINNGSNKGPNSSSNNKANPNSTGPLSSPPKVGPILTGGLKGISRIDAFELKDKNLFLRLDLNVPLDHSSGKTKITNDNRIRAALPTIQYALEQGARIVVASHLGRPEKAEERHLYSMEPIAAHLSELLSAEVILIEDPASDAPKALFQGLKGQQILMLENLRYDEGEVANSSELAMHWSSYTDVYINDAFGACHRAHASIEALPRLVAQKGIGFLIEKEITNLDSVIYHPEHPYMAILGGAKVSDKIPVIEKLMDLVDVFIIGGAMAYTFLAAKGVAVGKSRVEKDRVNFAKEMLARIEARNKKILLPIDHLVVSEIASRTATLTTSQAIASDMLGVDIGPKTIELYSNELKKAKCVFWNGPMGIFERKEFSQGTFKIAEILAGLEDARTIVGGGDSAAAAEESGFAEQMTHISTGGGASLEYLQGEKLPGLEILRARRY
jgi:phosphoglycerate kinase